MILDILILNSIDAKLIIRHMSRGKIGLDNSKSIAACSF